MVQETLNITWAIFRHLLFLSRLAMPCRHHRDRVFFLRNIMNRKKNLPAMAQETQTSSMSLGPFSLPCVVSCRRRRVVSSSCGPAARVSTTMSSSCWSAATVYTVYVLGHYWQYRMHLS
jgi:hypothetical protein